MIEHEYSKAIFELAQQDKKENTIYDNFLDFSTLISDQEFYNVLVSPFIKQNDKKEIIKKSLKGFNEMFINFLYVLIDNNRIEYFNSIKEEYNKLLLNSNNVMLIEIKSAKKLTNAQIKDIEASLKNKYVGKQLKFENIIDPTLIGGIELYSNGDSIDISVKSQLNKLKASL